MAHAINADQLDPYMAESPDDGGPMAWLSPRQDPFRIDGFCWLERDGRYRRMPVTPDWPLRPEVDHLADATAGGQIRFRTDSGRVAVRVKLAGPPNMNHMAATGQCGFDVYVGEFGDARYWGTARPTLDSDEYSATFFTTPNRTMRTIALNFPLYQGVAEVEIGLDPDAAVEAPPAHQRPGKVVVYGTSITQGGCATRPGMAYPAILARRLGMEVVNLGFSGNGRGEPEVARTLAQLDDVACFVLDYESNVREVEDLRTTLGDFITILRERHAEVPIIVTCKTQRIQEQYDPDALENRLAKRAVQAEIVDARRQAGDTRIEFLDLGGHDLTEGSVDGVHPSDLGFLQLADLVEPALRRWI